MLKGYRVYRQYVSGIIYFHFSFLIFNLQRFVRPVKGFFGRIIPPGNYHA